MFTSSQRSIHNCCQWTPKNCNKLLITESKDLLVLDSKKIVSSDVVKAVIEIGSLGTQQ